MEYPFHVGAGSSGKGRPSRNTCRYVMLYSFSNTNSSGVCTNFFMKGNSSMRGPPGVRHCVYGSSASRFAAIFSFAHCWYGKPPVSPAPMLPNCWLIGRSVHTRRIPSHGRSLATCQIPERLGFPSAVRGAGASRFGWPFSSRGIPGVGYFTHCAFSIEDESQSVPSTTITTTRFSIRDFLSWLAVQEFIARKYVVNSPPDFRKGVPLTATG